MKYQTSVWKYAVAALFAMVMAVGVVFGSAQPAKAYSGWQFPCSGYGVSGYSFGQWISGWGYHLGEDVCSQAGRAVYATADGVVMYSARTPDSYRWGNLILIQHDNNDGSTATGIYGHLSNDRRVGAGQSVSKGQLIGFVGPSWTGDNGNWAAHLHYGVKTGGYGAGVGSYDPAIKGYRGDGFGPYAHPTNYINGRIQSPPAYSARFVAQSAAPSVLSGGQKTAWFQFRNTGTATWTKNTVRLGTIRPGDRDSGFARNGGGYGPGWLSTKRIQMDQDSVAPGQTAGFTFTVTGNPAPGTYSEYFRPVAEGITWMEDFGAFLPMTVRAPEYKAQWTGQNAYAAIDPANTTNAQDPRYLTPGKKMNLKVFLRNVGDYPWTSSGPNPVRLGNSHPNDRGSAFATGGDSSIPLSENWPQYTRPSNIDGRYNPSNGSITSTDTIQPGETAVFSFTITAPNAPGEYTEYFNPLVEGKTWMNDLGIWFKLRVLPPGYHYEWVTQQNPAPIQLARTSSQASVDIRNSGQTAWPLDGNVRLGTWNPRDRESAFGASWLSNSRIGPITTNVSNPNDPVVRPGQVARFSFNVQANAVRNGTYPEYLRPLAENEAWFPEDYGVFVPVTVNSPERDHQVVSQSFSRDVTNLHYGDTFTTKLAVRNLGSRTWSAGGPNPLRLGTIRPTNREGGFSDLTALDPWLSTTRASGIDGLVTNLSPLTAQPAESISQGQIAYFDIPMKVPNGIPLGRYNEYFNLLEENLAWFPDLGVFFPFDVTGP